MSGNLIYEGNLTSYNQIVPYEIDVNSVKNAPLDPPRLIGKIDSSQLPVTSLSKTSQKTALLLKNKYIIEYKFENSSTKEAKPLPELRHITLPQNAKQIVATDPQTIVLTEGGNLLLLNNNTAQASSSKELHISPPPFTDIASISTSDDQHPSIFLKKDGTAWIDCNPTEPPNSTCSGYLNGDLNIGIKKWLIKPAIATAIASNDSIPTNVLILDNEHTLWAAMYNTKPNIFQEVSITLK